MATSGASSRDITKPRVTRIELRGGSAYVVGQRRAILVDSGLVRDSERLVRRLIELDFLRDLTLVLATHGHADHTGGLAAVKQEDPGRIKIATHAAATPFVEAGRNAPCRPATFLGHLACPFISMLPSSPGVEVDIVLDGEASLLPYGVEGWVVPTPGHTLGCTSVVLPGGEAIVGDLLMTAFGRGPVPRLPLFTQDVSLWRQSVAGLLDRDIHTFHAGHGGPFSAQQVRQLLKHVERRRTANP